MDVKDYRQKKRDMEIGIADAVSKITQAFEAETGLSVSRVSIYTIERAGVLDAHPSWAVLDASVDVPL